MKRMHISQSGFTMVELIVGMVISALLAGMIALIIGAPVESYLQQGRNTELVEASDRITRTVSADFANALPNSVRIRNVGVRSIVQMLEVTDVVYFVPGSNPMFAAQQLDTTATAPTGDQFNALGRFGNSADTSFLIVNHTLLSDVYRNNSTVRVSVDVPETALPSVTTHSITLPAAFRFENGAPPTNRMFVVRETPITYICNLNTGLLQRYSGHQISQNIPPNESAAALNTAGTERTIVATGVTACGMVCARGTLSPCEDALTLSMTLERGAAPEISRIRVHHQVAVGNTP